MNNLSTQIKEEKKTFLKISFWKLIWISFLIWFLIFLLNIFLWFSIYTWHFSDTLKSKLWMYFYLKDIPWKETSTYKEIIAMKTELENQWLKVSFSSKDDALKFLEKKIPDITKNFEKFWIQNPLPATFYVMFNNDNQYKNLKTTILNHKNIILNTKDIDQWETVKDQENLTLKTINFTNFLKIISYWIIFVLCLIILAFMLFLLDNIFQHFRKDLETKKLLGESHYQIKKLFTTIISEIIIRAFVIWWLLVIISWYILDYYIFHLFNIRLLSFVWNYLTLIIWIILEIILIFWFSLLISRHFVDLLNKK
jgi:cell division protein FtsX